MPWHGGRGTLRACGRSADAGETMPAGRRRPWRLWSPARSSAGPRTLASPVLRIILQRARAGSRPRERDDEHVVCLAIEGGGMRGAVTAGMCVLLEAAGLTAAFDRIYGVSAGALNGWATAVGQAALSATHYQDAVAEGVVNRIGPLRGRPLSTSTCCSRS